MAEGRGVERGGAHEVAHVDVSAVDQMIGSAKTAPEELFSEDIKALAGNPSALMEIVKHFDDNNEGVIPAGHPLEGPLKNARVMADNIASARTHRAASGGDRFEVNGANPYAADPASVAYKTFELQQERVREAAKPAYKEMRAAEAKDEALSKLGGFQVALDALSSVVRAFSNMFNAVSRNGNRSPFTFSRNPAAIKAVKEYADAVEGIRNEARGDLGVFQSLGDDK